MSSTYISLSRNERTPDATELFNAKTSMAMGGKYRLRHIGNPNLKATIHTEGARNKATPMPGERSVMNRGG